MTECLLKADFEKHPFGIGSDTLAQNLAYLNESIIALRVKDAQASIDYLRTRDDLNLSDLTVAGFDAGGMTAFLTAAIDGRVRNALVSGAYIDRANLPAGLSMQTIAENIAPRNLWMEIGNQDQTLPIAQVIKTARQIQHIYNQRNAPNSFNFPTFAGGHRCNATPFMDWLAVHSIGSDHQCQLQLAGKPML